VRQLLARNGPTANDRRGSYWGKIRRDGISQARQFMTDAVEKGKNELIEIFAFAPVETGFS
jgi:hypothetical protein